MTRLVPTLRRARRALMARRRALAAVSAGGAVLVGLQAVSPPPPPTRPVLVAARDLVPGDVLGRSDLTYAHLPPATVPDGVLAEADALGRTTAAPLRRGEPLTDVRVVSGSLVSGYPGRVAAPVRIADAGSVRLLRTGDRVDVLAADPQGVNGAVVVAHDAPVVALPRAAGSGLSSGLTSGGLVVLAVREETAAALAAAGVSAYLSVTLRQ